MPSAGTIVATVAILKTWGVGKIKIISAIASKQGTLTVICVRCGSFARR